MALGQFIGNAIPHDEEASADERGASYVWGSAGAGADMGSSAGPIGMGIGAVIGTIYGWATAQDKEDELQAQIHQREKIKRETKYKADSATLSGVSTTGNTSQGYFKLGGKMYPRATYKYGGAMNLQGVKGGSLKTVAPNTKQVVSHQGKTDDVQLNNGKNVDHNELILDDNKVLSDELGFASKGRQLLNNPSVKAQMVSYDDAMKVVGKNDKVIVKTDPTDLHAMHTAERKSDINEQVKANNPHPLEVLFQLQEISKSPSVTGKMNYADGGEFDYRSLGLLADNVGNFIINQQTPQIPKLERYKAQPMETTLEVGDAIAAIDSNTANFQQTIDTSTSSSADSLKRKSLASVQNMEMKNQVYGQKARTEVELRNKNRANVQQVDALNTGLANREIESEVQRTVGMMDNAKANLANLSGDVSQVIETDNKKAYDKELADIYRERYSIYGKNLYDGKDNPMDDIELEFVQKYQKEKGGSVPDARKAFRASMLIGALLR